MAMPITDATAMTAVTIINENPRRFERLPFICFLKRSRRRGAQGRGAVNKGIAPGAWHQQREFHERSSAGLRGGHVKCRTRYALAQYSFLHIAQALEDGQV